MRFRSVSLAFLSVLNGVAYVQAESFENVLDFSHNWESSAPYLKLLDILNIDSIFKLKISLLAHKISQNEANIPEVFQNYLVKVSDIHPHNTR